MIGLNKWLFFENDLCEVCGHCKVVKLTSCEMSKELQVIVSCACDTAVFSHQWQSLAPAERIHCVGDMTVEKLLIMIGEKMQG